MNFEPVETMEELKSLNENDIIEGYRAGCANESEPTENKAMWHGWRNGMIDHDRLPCDAAYTKLAQLYVLDLRTSTKVMH